MMQESQLYRARMVASAAATLMSLACGSNYVYSAWAPQFAERLRLSSTESNLIGLAGNLGMYLMGLPIGMLVDYRGPRIAVLIGAVLMALGYFPMHQAYSRGSGSVPLMCFFMFLSGLGGCMAFAAAVKTSALNWPHSRGTATAFPLAAFGLSAFFFSSLGSLIFPGDPSGFLELLSWGTSGITLVTFFFMKVHQPASAAATYQAIPEDDGRASLSESQTFERMSTEEPKSFRAGRAAEPDIRGLRLIRTLEFWQLFCIMGILAGVGIMTINNIGNDAKALWKHYDNNVNHEFLIKRQQMHVSILSVCSFLGRLSSGVGSDFLVKNLNASRVWCLVIACTVFFLAQISALNISNPHLLWFVSGFSGLGYGFLFGVYPSIVAETFGIHSLSQNWGLMTVSPVISSNIFNIFYGRVYDEHSTVEPTGERSCMEGLDCYKSAYWATLGACLGGLALILWLIRHQRAQYLADHRKGEEED